MSFANYILAVGDENMRGEFETNQGSDANSFFFTIAASRV